MIVVFLLTFIFICFVDGGNLIKNGLNKELVAFIVLMGAAATLGVFSLFNLPTPIELLAKFF